METRLAELREDKDISQRKLAEYLHVHQTTYSSYELGRISIPPEALDKLADYYQTSTDYLLRRTDIKEPYPRPKRKSR